MRAHSEIWRGGVNAWECDENDHLNVRFWLAKAYEAVDALSADIGAPALRPDDVHIRFLQEARSGTSLYAVGGFSKDANGAATRVWVEMRRSADHAPAMTMTGSIAPRSAPAEFIQDAPAHAAPRGVVLTPPRSAARMSDAQALGLTRAGRRVIGPDYCDLDGHVRPDAAIGFISDCVGNLYAMAGADFDVSGDGGVGGVALEYRLVRRAAPRCGAVVSLMSGQAEWKGKVGRFAHWLIDETTGDAWCTAEAIVGYLDLSTRRLVAPPDTARRMAERAGAPNASC